LVGTVLDYIVTQILSQYLISNCSEDCYFRFFNIFFVVVALVSLWLGILGGVRSFRRSMNGSKQN